MALAKATGFVIRAFDYQESSRIVTLLSPRLGKISLLAKGARKLESRFGAALDLLNLIEVVFYEGRGLKLLKEAALIEGYPRLKRDYDRLEVALQAARALNLLLREGQGESRAYRLFQELLQELDREGELVRLSLLQLGFKLKLIDYLGFGPELEACASCGRPLARDEPAWLSPQAGGLVCADCRAAQAQAQAGAGPRACEVPPPLAQAWRASLRFPLAKLSRLVLPEELIGLGEELLEEFIAYHLQPI
ncbi:MAG: DNA repair protein RecO [Candidatus Acetothermia bacterium]|nr:DNA repair protein RecO [Candidatus Acetothermia bacterium]MDH7505043.1 DNA repair protein RecO [Candidatus Acetothermia bacterium]